MKLIGTVKLKRGLAQMLKGGVIMDVTNAEQARIAEEAGAVAVMALQKVPADIRASGGVARMASVEKIQEIMDAVSIPVMAKVRIGHFVEAQILEELGVDFIDESEVLTPADEFFHINKHKFKVPFVCGARSLGEAVRRIFEGAAMIRTKGEAGTGNVVEAVKHMRIINESIRKITEMDRGEIYNVARRFADSYKKLAQRYRSDLGLDDKIDEDEPLFDEFTYRDIVNGIYEILLEIKHLGRLPVVNFAAGGIATPADAAMMMQLGADGIFVGSGIFKSSNPRAMAEAIVLATTYYDDPSVLAEVSKDIGEAMRGIDIRSLKREELLQTRGL